MEEFRFQEFLCDVCNKVFQWKSDLAAHKVNHIGENRQNMVHTVEKPHACDFCDKNFARLDHLIDHKRKHTGEKPYDCDICGKKFSRLSSLNKHYKTHTGEKCYSCETCGKKFTHRDTFVKHLKVHMGEKPYSCEKCGQKFSNRGTWYHHHKRCQVQDPMLPQNPANFHSSDSNMNGYEFNPLWNPFYPITVLSELQQ